MIHLDWLWNTHQGRKGAPNLKVQSVWKILPVPDSAMDPVGRIMLDDSAALTDSVARDEDSAGGLKIVQLESQAHACSSVLRSLLHCMGLCNVIRVARNPSEILRTWTA